MKKIFTYLLLISFSGSLSTSSSLAKSSPKKQTRKIAQEAAAAEEEKSLSTLEKLDNAKKRLQEAVQSKQGQRKVYLVSGFVSTIVAPLMAVHYLRQTFKANANSKRITKEIEKHRAGLAELERQRSALVEQPDMKPELDKMNGEIVVYQRELTNLDRMLLMNNLAPVRKDVPVTPSEFLENPKVAEFYVALLKKEGVAVEGDVKTDLVRHSSEGILGTGYMGFANNKYLDDLKNHLDHTLDEMQKKLPAFDKDWKTRWRDFIEFRKAAFDYENLDWEERLSEGAKRVRDLLPKELLQEIRITQQARHQIGVLARRNLPGLFTLNDRRLEKIVEIIEDIPAHQKQGLLEYIREGKARVIKRRTAVDAISVTIIEETQKQLKLTFQESEAADPKNTEFKEKRKALEGELDKKQKALDDAKKDIIERATNDKYERAAIESKMVPLRAYIERDEAHKAKEMKLLRRGQINSVLALAVMSGLGYLAFRTHDKDDSIALTTQEYDQIRDAIDDAAAWVKSWIDTKQET